VRSDIITHNLTSVLHSRVTCADNQACPSFRASHSAKCAEYNKIKTLGMIWFSYAWPPSTCVYADTPLKTLHWSMGRGGSSQDDQQSNRWGSRPSSGNDEQTWFKSYSDDSNV